MILTLLFIMLLASMFGMAGKFADFGHAILGTSDMAEFPFDDEEEIDAEEFESFGEWYQMKLNTSALRAAGLVILIIVTLGIALLVIFYFYKKSK